MDDMIVTENIPATILMLLTKFFKEGQVVNDYKIIGNTYGHSITLHITHPNDQAERSPGKGKSPSTYNRDRQRLHDLWGRPPPFAMDQCHQEVRLESGNVGSDNVSHAAYVTGQLEKHVSYVPYIDQDSLADHVNDMTDALSDKATSCIAVDTADANVSTNCVMSTSIGTDMDGLNCRIDAHVNTDHTMSTNIATDVDGLECDTTDADTCRQDININDKQTEETRTDQTDISQPTVEASRKPNGRKKLSHDEQIYRENIMDKRRNLNFTKIVHDTRNEQSKVYGITDDMIFSVDENNKKYFTYAMHDAKGDKVCRDIKEMIERWPSAKPAKCEYGVWCLKTLLPDILKSNRESY